jgi:hypothetical protein
MRKPQGRRGGFSLAKNLITIILVVFYLLLTANVALAFRCGGDLILIGDRSFTVLRKCGEPISKEIIGYTLTGDRKREFKIEEWVYGPIGSRYIHLIFEGGKLVKIESIPE